MGDVFVKTEELVDKYLKRIEKQIKDALDCFKNEGFLTKKFTESFQKKATERVKQTCERYQPRKKPSSPVSNGNEGRQMNLSSVGNALKRELETTENIRDHMKKQKLNEPTPANEKMGSNLFEVKTEAGKQPTAGPSGGISAKNASEPIACNINVPHPGEGSSRQSLQVVRGIPGEPDFELKEQLQRSNQVYITIPERLIQTEQNRRDIFQKICERLAVKIPPDQLEEIFREESALVVKFRDLKYKEMIMESADRKKVFLDQIIDGEKLWRIHVRHYMTWYYSKLHNAAQEYKETRFLHSFQLTDKGLVVKLKENSKGKTVLSMRELNDYVNMKKT